MPEMLRGEVRLNLVVPHPGLPSQPGSHPFHELIYILKGAYRVRLAKETWSAQAGDALLYPAGTEHAPIFSQDLSIRLMALQWLDAASPLPLKRPLRARDEQGRALCAIEWIRGHYPPRTAEDRKLIRLLVWAILYELFGSNSETHRLTNPVEDAAQILRHGFNLPFSIRELAAHVELSPSRLTHRFRSELGLSPSRYLQRLRLEQALQLILNSRLALKEVAARVGYRNEFYLSSLIKRTYGRSPSRLRSAKAADNRQSFRAPRTGRGR
jgi:AraC-like DNA-binding protein